MQKMLVGYQAVKAKISHAQKNGGCAQLRRLRAGLLCGQWRHEAFVLFIILYFDFRRFFACG
jgi:hypothetical protein